MTRIAIYKKLLLLSGMLLQLLIHGEPKTTHFGAVSSPLLQTPTQNLMLIALEANQNSNYALNGTYIHIPETTYLNQYPSTYRADEMLYPDGTRGYQIVFSHYEQVPYFNATTSKMDTQPVLKQTSYGFGTNATQLTW